MTDKVAEIARIVERGGSLNPQEKQLAKRYAVFFRMPRLSGATPPDLNRSHRNGSTASESVSYPGTTDINQQLSQVQEQYPPSTNLSVPMGNTIYEPSMFDPRNFPQLQQEFYDENNGIDFGFSDFFGGSENWTTHLPAPL